MAETIIKAGICGFTSTVRAEAADDLCRLTAQSECPHVTRMAGDLAEVDPYGEITWRGDGPRIYAAAKAHLPHPACPVPAGMVKAVEVACGLALPKDASITFGG